MEDRIRFLVGDRLHLRPLEEADLRTCQRWVNSPEIRRAVGSHRVIDFEAEKAFYAAMDRSSPPKRVTLGIVRSVDDQLIGVTGLEGINWVHRFAETGIFLGDPKTWGQGFGPEAKNLLIGYAFEVLNLRRLDARVLGNNTRSLAALKRQGYQVEGTQRGKYFVDGAYRDEVFMGLMRADWRASVGESGE